MKLAIGILLIIAGLIFLRALIRVFPPGRWRFGYLRPTNWFDILKPLITILVLWGVGISLVLGAPWWTLLIGAVIWVVLSFVIGYFNPEGDLIIKL